MQRMLKLKYNAVLVDITRCKRTNELIPAEDDNPNVRMLSTQLLALTKHLFNSTLHSKEITLKELNA